MIDSKILPVLDKLKETIGFMGIRYEVTLPWKEFYPRLPDNLCLSEKRLSSLMRRPQHDSDTDAIIILQQGIVELVEQVKSRRCIVCHTICSSV